MLREGDITNQCKVNLTEEEIQNIRQQAMDTERRFIRVIKYRLSH